MIFRFHRLLLLITISSCFGCPLGAAAQEQGVSLMCSGGNRPPFIPPFCQVVDVVRDCDGHSGAAVTISILGGDCTTGIVEVFGVQSDDLIEIESFASTDENATVTIPIVAGISPLDVSLIVTDDDGFSCQGPGVRVGPASITASRAAAITLEGKIAYAKDGPPVEFRGSSVFDGAVGLLSASIDGVGMLTPQHFVDNGDNTATLFPQNLQNLGGLGSVEYIDAQGCRASLEFVILAPQVVPVSSTLELSGVDGLIACRDKDFCYEIRLSNPSSYETSGEATVSGILHPSWQLLAVSDCDTGEAYIEQGGIFHNPQQSSITFDPATGTWVTGSLDPGAAICLRICVQAPNAGRQPISLCVSETP